MTRILTFALVSLIAAVGATYAQETEEKKAAGENPMVVMTTSLGEIEIDLYPEKAPVSVENFLTYVDEKFFVTFNGAGQGSIFVDGAHDCPETPDVDTIVLAAATFNVLVAGGDATVLVIPASSVDPEECEVTSVRVTLGYVSIDLDDCNGNGVPDGCDIASGRSDDVDGDGVPDECG